jgi:transcriptional regulator with XRE-family HTH domain
MDQTIVLDSNLTGKQVKAWRKKQKLSAQQLAKLLQYRRAYIKSIEGGSLPVSSIFKQRFLELQSDWSNQKILLSPPLPSKVISKYKLPAQLTIEARPRRCRDCKNWFVFAWNNQRTCNGCKRKKKESNSNH